MQHFASNVEDPISLSHMDTATWLRTVCKLPQYTQTLIENRYETLELEFNKGIQQIKESNK